MPENKQNSNRDTPRWAGAPSLSRQPVGNRLQLHLPTAPAVGNKAPQRPLEEKKTDTTLDANILVYLLAT